MLQRINLTLPKEAEAISGSINVAVWRFNLRPWPRCRGYYTNIRFSGNSFIIECLPRSTNNLWLDDSNKPVRPSSTRVSHLHELMNEDPSDTSTHDTFRYGRQQLRDESPPKFAGDKIQPSRRNTVRLSDITARICDAVLTWSISPYIVRYGVTLRCPAIFSRIKRLETIDRGISCCLTVNFRSVSFVIVLLSSTARADIENARLKSRGTWFGQSNSLASEAGTGSRSRRGKRFHIIVLNIWTRFHAWRNEWNREIFNGALPFEFPMQ